MLLSPSYPAWLLWSICPSTNSTTLSKHRRKSPSEHLPLLFLLILGEWGILMSLFLLLCLGALGGTCGEVRREEVDPWEVRGGADCSSIWLLLRRIKSVSILPFSCKNSAETENWNWEIKQGWNWELTAIFCKCKRMKQEVHFYFWVWCSARYMY